jgi:threonine dehydrogenase-like Zn-dependent dehydrogenase
MRALTWQGTEKVQVVDVEDPVIEEPTDAIVRVTSTAICGSDLHLYRILGMYIDEGDILGHEPMGFVEEVGSGVDRLSPGDRVVIPFNISCGHCGMCQQNLFSQCETTQAREYGTGAALFGYTKMYGQVPGGQAQYLRVPQAHFGPIKVPDDGRPDERYLFLSDILPTAWQAVQYAAVPPDGTVGVFGLGPVGQFCTRVALHLGAQRVLGVDMVPERLELARRHGVETLDASAGDDVPAELIERTAGRGPDSVIDAVGMEAHGSPVPAAAQRLVGLLPDGIARSLTERISVDRMTVLHQCIAAVRRGGTVSISGVYGGAIDPLPMMQMFDKQVTLRMGQANVRAWTDLILPLVTGDDDSLGVMDLVTHRMPLEDAPVAYEMFQRKDDGCIKVVLTP